ncbi:MAG TPA: dihydrodipicolinate synthase family protein [Gemmatimonadaceae bacterium]|jgi:dihydrodipicolinate synthase/N-acetylneuraminate lyase|nr:dihydrodipicolinate synthase family protein [Gemmatimonadaceae bacterium]
MMNQLRGVFAPVITTFYPQTGELDLASFAANIRSHLAAGLHGIVVTGSTGEATLLDSNERAAMVDAAREMVPSDKTLIVGTGAESTRTCLELTRDAASRGADAVLVVAPHYYGAAMTTPALSKHYRRIADESPVPVVLYNIPKYMHFSLAPGLVSELSLHDNIVGIKDSSGDLSLLASYLNAESESFAVLTGNAGTFLGALRAGAHGGILAVALFAAAMSLDVYEAELRGDDAAADAAQARLTPLGAKIVGEMGVAGVKAAMDRVGLLGGPVRSPLLPLDEARRALVAELLRSAELATAV